MSASPGAGPVGHAWLSRPGVCFGVRDADGRARRYPSPFNETVRWHLWRSETNTGVGVEKTPVP